LTRNTFDCQEEAFKKLVQFEKKKEKKCSSHFLSKKNKVHCDFVRMRERKTAKQMK
jgi:hypothetical protein